jgi:hypothetical protein
MLNVKYKSGESRNLNLHLSFFDPCEYTISQRATDFAFMHGRDPYHVSVTRGNEILFERTYRNNVPERKAKVHKIDERQIKKDLKKEFKNVPFTLKYKV